MAAITLIEQDLYEDISQEELDGLARQLLVLTLTAARPCQGSAALDTFTDAGHGMVDGQCVVFAAAGGISEIQTGTTYFVVQPATNTFKISLRVGGPAIDLGADGSGTTYQQGQRDPIGKEIAESFGLIGMYVEPYRIKDDVRRRLWKLLCISGIYNRLGKMPQKRKDERDWCMAVLRDIRDGKFPNLLYDEDLPAEETSQGAYGSACRQPFGHLLPTKTTVE